MSAITRIRASSWSRRPGRWCANSRSSTTSTGSHEQRGASTAPRRGGRPRGQGSPLRRPREGVRTPARVRHSLMLPFLLSAALATAQPTPCPTDIVVANPRLKVVRAPDRAYDNDIITVSVTNTGGVAPPPDVPHPLDRLIGPTVVVPQPIPPLASHDSYEAAFRF